MCNDYEIALAPLQDPPMPRNEETCHEGDYPPCLVSVSQKCRCRLTARTTECYRTREENFTCTRQRCSERCCPSSKKIGTPSLNG